MSESKYTAMAIALVLMTFIISAVASRYVGNNKPVEVQLYERCMAQPVPSGQQMVQQTECRNWIDRRVRDPHGQQRQTEKPATAERIQQPASEG